MTDTTPSEALNGLNGARETSSSSPTAWSTPGPAAFDFRSDVVTTPTPSMLAAIQNCSLLDDVFHEDPTTNDLESYIADLTGHEAGLLVLSGTMGNQLSLRTLLAQPPHSVLADGRSHIIGWEAGGVASLSGALTTPVLPSNSTHLTLWDIQNHAILSTDIHACPTRVIALENTLAGTILPLADCHAINAWARKQDPPILMHMDGARLWEAVAAQAGSTAESQRQLLKEYCQCFDSVSLCFSKGLGAPIGSLIVGSQSFIARARWIRKSIGGGLRQAGVIASAARVAVEETFLGGLLAGSHVQAKQVAEMWTSRGGKLLQPTETNMAWLDLGAAGMTKEKFVAMALAEGVKAVGGRLVVHYQISPEALTRLAKVMDSVLSPSEPLPEITNGTEHKADEAAAKGELME